MCVQNILQLAGINIVPAGNDHTLDALLEIDKPVVVHIAQVAGVYPHPPIGVGLQGLRRLLGVSHIFHHHGRAGNADLTLLAVGQALLRTGLYNVVVGIGERQPDGPLLRHMGRGQTACGHALGRAVALPHLNDRMVVKQELVKPLFQLDGKAVAAGEHALEEAQISALHRGQTQQGFVQGGYAGNKVAPVLQQQLGIALRGKAGHQHTPSALRKHRMNGNAQSEAVEHRHDRQHSVAGAEHQVGGNDLLPQRIKIQIGKQNSLGNAGGAAAVQDHRRILAFLVHLVLPAVAGAHLHKFLPANNGCVSGDLLDLPPLGQHIAHLNGLGKLVLDAGDDDIIKALHILANCLKLVVELVQRQSADAAGLLEVEFDLFFAGKRVYHVGNTAHQVHRIEHNHSLGTVGHANGDLIPLADPDSLQRTGAKVDLLHKLFIGGAAPHKVIGNVFGIFLGDLLYRLIHTPLKIIQRRRHIAQVGDPWSSGLSDGHSLPPHWRGAPAVPGAPADISAT